MKKFLLFCWSLFFSYVFSQGYDREISYGPILGATYSKMNGIERSIIPEGIYQGYSTKEKSNIGLSGGLFLNWKYTDKNLSLQPELWYSGQKVNFEYSDIKGLNYNIRFNYHYLNAGFLLKYYFTDGLYLGAGPYFSFNLSKDNLTYTSNGEELMNQIGVYFEPDAVVQKTLKQSFEGKDYFHLAFALGYEFENKLSIGARYQMGFADAMETLDNGHRFRNTPNKVGAISLHIGYRFTFDHHNNF